MGSETSDFVLVGQDGKDLGMAQLLHCLANTFNQI